MVAEQVPVAGHALLLSRHENKSENITKFPPFPPLRHHINPSLFTNTSPPSSELSCGTQTKQSPWNLQLIAWTTKYYFASNTSRVDRLLFSKLCTPLQHIIMQHVYPNSYCHQDIYYEYEWLRQAARYFSVKKKKMIAFYSYENLLTFLFILLLYIYNRQHVSRNIDIQVWTHTEQPNRFLLLYKHSRKHRKE